MDPDAHEHVLRTRLLRRGGAGDPDAVRELLDVVCRTRAAPLWRAAGRIVGAALATAAGGDLAEAALAADLPAWRLQPLARAASIRTFLLARLDADAARARIAALRGLAPVVADPQVRDAILARLDDPAEQVRSTAIEIVRPIAAAAPVRAGLLTLFSSPRRLPHAVDRALRRTLRAAAAEPDVQQAMLAALHAERRPWIATAALAGAPERASLTAGLLALLARRRSHHLSDLWPAFVPIAHVPEVMQRFTALLADDSPFVVQSALRVVGRCEDPAAREAVLAALAHRENYVRWGAAEQLAPSAREPPVRAALLARLADDPDDGVRMIVARQLADFGDDPDIHLALVARLADPSPAVAVAAAGALCRRAPHPPAWDVLRPHLTGPLAPRALYSRSWQSIRPLAVLGQLPALPHVRDALAGVLADHDPERRTAAARALRRSPPDPAIADRLAACIADDLPPVAGAAYETLAAWVGHSHPTSAD